MDKALAELIRISNTTGKDPALVQGGGGNTSVKTADGKYMYIKASGTALKDMTRRAGWRRLRLGSVLTIIKDKSIAGLDTHVREAEVVNRLLLACDDEVTVEARPSVEAHLHALLDRCVIHLHPNAVGAYVNAKNGKAKLQKLFNDEKFPPLWVPYTDPGFMLARKIAKLVDNYQNQFGKHPKILFLEKHGLFISTNSAGSALRLVGRVINRCSASLRQPRSAKPKKALEPHFAANGKISAIAAGKLAVRRAFFEVTGRYDTVSWFCDETIAAFWRQKNAPKLLSSPALTPDELIYAHGPAVWLDQCRPERITRKLTSQINAGRDPALAFLVKGLGLFVVGKSSIAPIVRDIAETSFFIRTNANRMGGISSLSRRQQDFINRWEAEAFRIKLAVGSSQGPLQDRIAVVTGSGSGLGRSIAIGLAGAGASVGLADIDTKAAQQTYNLIKEQSPQAQVCVLPCDVTSEASVIVAFDSLLKVWGGLDILVNAAGIAPAYPLTEMPVEKFRLALDVNLTGYFLMAKAAAIIMKAQAMGGSIINISSKTGLQASVDNTAYNTTKAGEIHMARGWALELGEYGIRVNCVCPGNVFEGSKIWNPEYIKVCAKKCGIKPAEVIPYYVNKTSLKREIKGNDIADSVVFLCSEKAGTITGQTLVADSGQVMVR
jgi:NAD(P)-dependent dehydrogenase (short-subunit alcohol dehydrogenase family)/rhamnose utilization protein RhaD (predicted bifunctional aldolase and dehydrogenase)